MDVDSSSLRFLLNDTPLRSDLTVGDSGVQDGDHIDVVFQQQPGATNLNDEVFTITCLYHGRDAMRFVVKRSTRLQSVFDAMAQATGLKVSSLRFIFEMVSLRRDRTVGSYDMEDGDVIDCFLEQVGMIGIWRTPDSVHPFLLDPPKSPPSSLQPPSTEVVRDADLALLVAKLTKGKREDLAGTTVLDERLERALDPALCEKLRRLLDQRQLAETHKNNDDNNNNSNHNINNNHNDNNTVTDFKLYLTYSELCQHIGDVAAAALSRRIQGDYSFIVLRRCEPQGGIEPNQCLVQPTLGLRCMRPLQLRLHPLNPLTTHI